MDESKSIQGGSHWNVATSCYFLERSHLTRTVHADTWSYTAGLRVACHGSGVGRMCRTYDIPKEYPGE